MSQLLRAYAAVSWSDNVRVVSDPPDYEISAADRLVLVDKLGLASYLQDTAN